ncbi:hypothetical protein SERLADRAFT_413913 [Serpula lacrymans var. lacrymans S7.9]|uniref:Uncharacterized protein n=1 Tax=Serpula lacrymans var. lacrymans (strain S7.9) TaxID=578457 RepID=F8NNC2_SERL9|nr:uncharacterized protein SERLADRAFT_413913 [Serpula lacrymans var. lacrymans S7.9]EGO27552.1 hypothetical protein SERLADRAFT_413913 [Serpula lacrymans var. lacrymans S7.9]
MPVYDYIKHITPLTPPETELDSQLTTTPLAGPVGTGGEYDSGISHSLISPPERPGSQLRRTSTLAYHNTGLRDTRDRSLHRVSRHLVVVVPPPDFPPDHRHVSSLGPRERLSQGILMPLFPTMYGQLTAIAREFSFPSTAGLCLYLHISENGITMTPRISDDSWQYLWGHLFEARSPSTINHQLPISGRIEFDIDAAKARWYDAWISASLRDAADVMEHSQIHPSHWRGDSRTTFAEGHGSDERSENNSVVQHSVAKSNATRHVPRKLSLVDRLDTLSLLSGPKPSQHVDISPPAVQLTHALSPIPQSAAPQSSHVDLERRVNTWRASARLAPTPLISAYQLSMGAEDVPASEVLNDSPQEGEGVVSIPELNLDDFSWSISSMGPPSDLPESPLSPFRVPSVHLDRRLEGSMVLTPTTATSWGPPDDDWMSVISNIIRLPSPDLGQRMVDDYPPTPSTATSWGPPDNDWYSVASDCSRLPSPDLGQRMLDDTDAPTELRAVAAASATHLTDPWKGTPWPHVWPYIERSKSVTVKPTTTDASGDVFGRYPNLKISGGVASENFQPIVESRSTYPNFKIYPDVYPHFDLYPAPAGGVASEHSQPIVEYRSIYPNFKIYPDVYPYFDLYPAPAGGVASENSQPIVEYRSIYPNFKISGDVSMKKAQPVALVEGSYSKYQNLKNCPDAYPNFDLYPAIVGAGPSATKLQPAGSQLVDSHMHYPSLNIYPAVYPHFDLYPPVFRAGEKKSQQSLSELKPKEHIDISLRPGYPVFDIYPAQYPFNLDVIYPATHSEERHSSVRLPAHYPWFDLYPSVYPFVSPYHVLCPETLQPQRDKVRTSQYPDFDIYPAFKHSFIDVKHYGQKIEHPSGIASSPTASNVQAVTVKLAVHYPLFDLYPSVYPFVEPYPKLGQSTSSTVDKEMDDGSLNVKIHTAYPVFDIYPSVYPNFDIYPRVIEVASPPMNTDYRKSDLLSVRLDMTYPNFNLYPAIYPAFELYPSVLAADVSLFLPQPKSSLPVEGTKLTYHYNQFNARELPTKLPSYYPNVNPYPTVYPNIELYPPVSPQPNKRRPEIRVGVKTLYPTLVIYPAVYPYFDLYPGPRKQEVPNSSSILDRPSISLELKYPTFNIYPAVYPHFDIYPSLSAGIDTTVTTREIEPISTRLPACYPIIELYPPVYPHFEIYRSIPVEGDACSDPAVYPFIEIYPSAPVLDTSAPVFDSKNIRNGTSRRSRKTHSDLHTAVMKEERPLAKRQIKTHHHLHFEVFRDDVVWTPNYSPSPITFDGRLAIQDNSWPFWYCQPPTNPCFEFADIPATRLGSCVIELNY